MGLRLLLEGVVRLLSDELPGGPQGGVSWGPQGTDGIAADVLVDSDSRVSAGAT